MAENATATVVMKRFENGHYHAVHEDIVMKAIYLDSNFFH